MNTFQYVTRDYVPSIDLNTLGKTYDTLEQGHKEAVKAASDLEVEIAKLDMNESEDGFKQELVNEIKQTIDKNTIYGNSYGALDDLILKVGDIRTDGRVIGRLRNQAAKKEYDAKVDAMTIPEGMKQMYKEENPYYYNDGNIDNRTGRVLPGDMWKANTNPVKTVDRFALMNEALKIVAKESGGYDNATFLDAAGKPTSDVSQSVDGAIYKQIGTKFERLDKNKIKQAIQLARRTIAGAEDSLKQDYSYEEWKRKKLVEEAKKNGGNVAPYIQGYTDKNGNVYDYEDWLDNQFDDFAGKSAFNNIYTNTTYGTALENKRKRELAYNNKTGIGSNIEDFIRKGTAGAFDIGYVEVESNGYAGAVKAKRSANSSGLSIINKLNAQEFKGADSISDIIKTLRDNKSVTGPGTAANYIIQKYGDKLNQSDRVNLTNAFMSYVKSNQQINEMLKKAGNNVDALKFSENIDSQIYTNDNKYGREINNRLNDAFSNDTKRGYEIGDNVFQNILRIYDVKDLKDVGIEYTKNGDGNYVVVFDAKNKNLYPKFSSILSRAYNDTEGNNLWKWTKKAVAGIVSPTNYVQHVYTKNKDGSYDDETINTNVIYRNSGDTPAMFYSPHVFTNKLAIEYFNGIVQLYDNGSESASKIENEVGTVKGTENVIGVDVSTPGELYVRENAMNLGYTYEQARKEEERYKKRIDSAIANGNLAGGEIYLIGNPNDIHSSKKFSKQINDATELNLLLQHMYSVYPNNITRTYSPGTSKLKEGYQFTFTVPANDKNDITSGYRGKTISMYVTGSIDDGSGYKLADNPNVIAGNLLVTSRATGQAVENMGYDKNFGDTRLIPNVLNRTYSTNFMGKDIELNEYQAKNYITQLYRLENLKQQLWNIVNNPNTPTEVKKQLLDNSLTNLSSDISNITGVSPQRVALAIQNYLNDN